MFRLVSAVPLTEAGERRHDGGTKNPACGGGGPGVLSMEVGDGSHAGAGCMSEGLRPRCLWHEAEAAYRWWEDHDRPEITRFGATVDGHGQRAWLDHR